jgi:hypothetical protein
MRVAGETPTARAASSMLRCVSIATTASFQLALQFRAVAYHLFSPVLIRHSDAHRHSIAFDKTVKIALLVCATE